MSKTDIGVLIQIIGKLIKLISMSTCLEQDTNLREIL